MIQLCRSPVIVFLLRIDSCQLLLSSKAVGRLIHIHRLFKIAFAIDIGISFLGTTHLRISMSVKCQHPWHGRRGGIDHRIAILLGRAVEHSQQHILRRSDEACLLVIFLIFIAEYAIDDTSSEGIKRPWIEGSSGDGTGESLKLSFGKKESLRLLSFDLGYARDKARSFKNSRPKSLLLKFSDGSKVECEFQDKMETQYVYFNRPVETDSVEIVIMSAYTKCTEDGLNYYQDRDTGIFLVKAYKD